MTNLNSAISFKCGLTLKNRFALAPLTNQQSNEDGSLSTDELNWLTMRGKGGFGMVMTCASHVQEIGKGFPGQLGIFADYLCSGHKKITSNLKEQGCLSVIQLHHAGMRTPHELINEKPVCPSNNAKTDARGLNLAEVKQLRDDFINAAIRAKSCGYNGVEVHGAHGYIISQFLSADINNRTDEYGGSLLNRSRLLVEIIEGIRTSCGKEFLIGVRLSPERFGLDLGEIKLLCQQLIDQEFIDFLDISLWDYSKLPNEPKYQNKTLLEHFLELDFKDVKWTVAGKIYSSKDVQKVIDAGVDFASIGTSAILHHNFPDLVINNPDFNPISIPVSEEHLIKEGLGTKFIQYLKRWPDFVK